MIPIETIAVVFAVFILLKLVVAMARPKFLISMSDKMISNKALFMLIGLILTAVTAYYVLPAIGMVEIGAVMAMTFSLMILAYAPFSKHLLDLRQKVGESALKKSWLTVILWVGIAIWILYTVFL